MLDRLKYRVENQAQGYVVLEFPPKLRTVKLLENYYRLSFPYMVFILHYFKEQSNERQNTQVFSFAHLTVGIRDKPLKSLESKIFFSWLPNFYETFDCCLETVSHAFMPLENLVTYVIGEFWNSEFTHDGDDEGDVENWAEKTKKNPDYWKKVKLRDKSAMPISYFLQSQLPQTILFNSLKS